MISFDLFTSNYEQPECPPGPNLRHAVFVVRIPPEQKTVNDEITPAKPIPLEVDPTNCVDRFPSELEVKDSRCVQK